MAGEDYSLNLGGLDIVTCASLTHPHEGPCWYQTEHPYIWKVRITWERRTDDELN